MADRVGADYAAEWEDRRERRERGTLRAPQVSGTTSVLQAAGFFVGQAGFGLDHRVPGALGGIAKSVLRCRNHQPNPAGLASVHIQARTLNPDVVAVGNDPNTRFLADVHWQTDLGGGEAVVDVTRGSIFSIGGAYSVEVDVYRRRNDPESAAPGALTHLVEKRIDATVHWSNSISPKAALVSTDTLTLNAGATSAAVDIPSQAESVLVLTDTPAVLGATTLGLFVGKTAVAFASTLNPFANGTPIVHGAESLKVTNGSAVNGVKYILVFELWL